MYQPDPDLKFIKHLEATTEHLKTWPAWKRNMLGPVFAEDMKDMPMTNDLKQAYDRAMAHNAMLREALDYVLSWQDNSDYDDRGQQALNATEAVMDAWEKKLRQDVMLAVHPLQPEYERLQQQLVTVTQERDELQRIATEYQKLYRKAADERDALRKLILKVKRSAFGEYCAKLFISIKRKYIPLPDFIDKELAKIKALAQKGGE